MNAPMEGFALAQLANIDAEHAVLGSLLQSPDLWDYVGDMLQPADFFRSENGEIFAAIHLLVVASKPVDIITVHEQMRAAGCDIDLVALNEIAQAVHSPASVRQYADIVRQRALSRRMLTACEDIQALAVDHALPFQDRLEQATGHLATLLQDGPSDDWVGVDQTIIAVLNTLNERASGNDAQCLPTGLTDLDEKLDGGLRAGQLVIIGARPSMGKSALAVSIGMNAADRGIPVAMFSLEMPKEELAKRQLSMVSHVHLSKLNRPERLSDWDWSRVTEGVEKLSKVSFHISEHSGININQLRTRARKQKRQHGLGLLIVDYIGLMTGTNPKESRNYQLGEVSRGLKGLAKELGVPIICLAQLGREVEKRTTGRPVLSDLRDSGEIEQDADIVIFIDRPIHRNPEAGEQWRDYAEAFVAKHRNGALGTVDLRYVGENVTFLNWEGERPTRSGVSRGGDL